jgi:hypothetical protein
VIAAGLQRKSFGACRHLPSVITTTVPA